MGHRTTSDGTILVIDDVDQDRLLMVGLLTQAGHTKTIAAASVEAARQVLRGNTTANLILLNMMMADVDALAFCRELKRDPDLGGIPIIALAAADDHTALEQFFAAGASDYLAKPIHHDSLLRRVEIALWGVQTTIRHPAQDDFLTGQPNRLLLNDRLAHALAAAQRKRCRVAVLLIGLDPSRQIDGSVDLPLQDGLLRELAARIKTSLRGWDTFCRLESDDFIVILTDIEQATDAAHAVARLIKSMGRPCLVAGHELLAHPSVGISIYPDDAEEVETLIDYADTAMHYAKDNVCPHNFQFFAPPFNATVLERLTLENALRQAIRQNQLMLHYQPQVDTAGGRVIGAEAQIRWQHPEWGLYMPDKFIAATEDSTLILDISVWMLREVCRQNACWQKAGLPPIPVAVHLAGPQFRQGDLPRLVAEALATEGLAPKWLELEVSEECMIAGMDEAIAMLNIFHDIGVSIAIDDFGTGFSCLTRLRHFPLQRLKIAQEFIRNLGTDPSYREIVNAIISMGKSLRLRVIAKGVETGEQLTILRENGCDEAQGYLFGRPMPAAEFEAVLRGTAA